MPICETCAHEAGCQDAKVRPEHKPVNIVDCGDFEAAPVKGMVVALRSARDNQTHIPCTDKYCICNYFDQAIDALEKLARELYSSS